MESSNIVKSSSLPRPSPDGLHIASLCANRLILRSSSLLTPFRTINLPSYFQNTSATLKWCRPTLAQPWSYRILLYTPSHIKIYDLRDAQYSATINNGSGGMGKIACADFGFSLDEVLVWSEFGSKLTIWNLVTGKSVEIKDPKFSTNPSRGWLIRPEGEGRTRVCALLSRVGAQDVLTLHAPRSWRVLKTVTLTTHDAQGMKWSSDGRWLAVWDSAGMGTKIHIYTADGCLYRTYNAEAGTDAELQLGVKSLEWSLCGRYLAVGGYERRLVLLSTRSFAPKCFLEHTASVQIAEGSVWQESVSASGKRDYTAVAQPITPPLAAASSASDLARTGISILAFNADGSLLATRDDAAPTAVWVWDTVKLRPRTILLQHSPVKKLSWHAHRSDLLLIQCAHEEPVIYLWAALSDSPMVISAPLQKSSGKLDMSWLPAKPERKPAMLASDSGGFVLVWPDGRDAVEEFADESQIMDQTEAEVDDGIDESLDSVVEMLAGRTPLPTTLDATAFEQTMGDVDDGDTTGSFEDTFRGKRPLMT